MPIWATITALTLSNLTAWYYIARLQRRFRNAFASLSSKRNLVDTLGQYFKAAEVTQQQLADMQSRLQSLMTLATRSLQKTGIVRFNPFRDTGGNQSFVLAMLDSNDNGFLLTSIHGREGTRNYIKPIAAQGSKLALSEEEKSALGAALASGGATTKKTGAARA